MSTPFQIVVDCADPHLVAAFWASALGYQIEDDTDFVTQMVEQGDATEDDTMTVDGRKAWRGAAACSDPADGRPRLLFLQVPEPKQVKNRVHLDLHVGTEGRGAEVARLLGLGATRIGEGTLGPYSWIVLADPEGNELCVA